ncbi:MAG: hypothetical protein R6V53_02280 [Candidatus Woesearchaeota archaeon]
MDPEAFEWLVGLYLQKCFGAERVLPQARLLTEKSFVTVDFYCYDEERQDGEIYEVKRTGVDLDSCVERYYPAAQCKRNTFNSGKNVNIDTDREHLINLIAYNDTGYRHPFARYTTFDKLWDDPRFRMCFRQVQGMVGAMIKDSFLEGFEGVKRDRDFDLSTAHAGYDTELEIVRVSPDSLVVYTGSFSKK